jgi:hypothetical protein
MRTLQILADSVLHVNQVEARRLPWRAALDLRNVIHIAIGNPVNPVPYVQCTLEGAPRNTFLSAVP